MLCNIWVRNLKVHLAHRETANLSMHQVKSVTHSIVSMCVSNRRNGIWNGPGGLVYNSTCAPFATPEDIGHVDEGIVHVYCPILMLDVNAHRPVHCTVSLLNTASSSVHIAHCLCSILHHGPVHCTLSRSTIHLRGT